MKVYDSTSKDAQAGQTTFLKPLKQRGGKRANAGRKSKRGSTSVMRVPDAYRDAINALINMLDDQANETDFEDFKGVVEAGDGRKNKVVITLHSAKER